MIRPKWLQQLSPQTPIYSFYYTFHDHVDNSSITTYCPIRWRFLKLDIYICLNTQYTPKFCQFFQCNRFNFFPLWGESLTWKTQNSTPAVFMLHLFPTKYKSLLQLINNQEFFSWWFLTMLSIDTNNFSDFNYKCDIFFPYQVFFFHIMFLLLQMSLLLFRISAWMEKCLERVSQFVSFVSFLECTQLNFWKAGSGER